MCSVEVSPLLTNQEETFCFGFSHGLSLFKNTLHRSCMSTMEDISVEAKSKYKIPKKAF